MVSLRIQSFADVPITDAGVDTVAFLEASQGLLGLFGAWIKFLFDFLLIGFSRSSWICRFHTGPDRFEREHCSKCTPQTLLSAYF